MLFKLKILLFYTIIQTVFSVKICNNELDYYVPYSENCWDSPIDTMTISEIARNIFGFYSEEHTVLTKDGYSLNIARFYWKISKKNPVILGHGTFTNGVSYLSSMENSLGYILASEGYDVWVMNFRGTKFSRQHNKFDEDDSRFWNFSFHEIGMLDLPATIDYIYNMTNNRVLYVGMSMGTSAILVHSSLHVDETKEKVIGTVLIAPAGIFVNRNSSFVYIDPRTTNLPYFLGHYMGSIMYDKTIFKNLFLKEAANFPVYVKALLYSMSFLDGYNPQKFDWTTLPMTIVTCLDVGTVKNQIHYNQCIETSEFKYFDYGKDQNLKKYKKEIPPKYPLNKIDIPVAIIASNGDIITPIEGIKKLYSQLKNRTKCGFLTLKDSSITHIQMMTSKNIKENINLPVLKYLNDMEDNKCQS